MKAAVENLAIINSNKKILMLGAMMEMGSESINEHKALIDLIKKFNWFDVVLVGGDFKSTHENFKYFDTASEAAEWFKEQTPEDAYILIKGSRSMQMEKILQ